MNPQPQSFSQPGTGEPVDPARNVLADGKVTIYRTDSKCNFTAHPLVIVLDDAALYVYQTVSPTGKVVRSVFCGEHSGFTARATGSDVLGVPAHLLSSELARTLGGCGYSGCRRGQAAS